MPAKEKISLAFVSSAYNEEANLRILYQRCRKAYETLAAECGHEVKIIFRFLVADNASEDDSITVMTCLCEEDPAVSLIVNHKNYGPETSVAGALKVARNCDLIVLLCSDLQDPPELATEMVKSLLRQNNHDAVLAIKERSVGNAMLRLARRCYYKVLGYSTRLQKVPVGFHGFGCYRRDVIADTLRYWEQTDLNLRQCLTNACNSPLQIMYQQADRVHGVSSYRGWGYWSEAFRSLAAADASASRLALFIGAIGLTTGVVAAVLLAFNFLLGETNYSSGTPTLMALVLVSFTTQMLMFGLLSRQIEALRMGGIKPQAHFRLIGSSFASARDQTNED